MVLVLLLLIVLMSGCGAQAVETILPIEESTSTSAPIKTATLEPTSTPTVEPTPTLTPTATPTPEPVLWCSDVIDDCYFLGNEIARIFAVTTLPCFENGGECYPPVEDCSLIPPSVIHILVEDFAQAWKLEVEANPEYVLLNPDLYDSETEYCFVDEGVAQMIRDAGKIDYNANKSCLDNDSMPCDVKLGFWKITDLDACGLECTVLLPGAYLNQKSFFVVGTWVIEDNFPIELSHALIGEDTMYSDFFNFAYIYVSTTAGFDENIIAPPADIMMIMKKN